MARACGSPPQPVGIGGDLRGEPGGTVKPASAAAMAGAKSCAQGSLPFSLCAASSMRSAPGTPTARPPIAAS